MAVIDQNPSLTDDVPRNEEGRGRPVQREREKEYSGTVKATPKSGLFGES
jgi:hypothetical protein